MHNYIQVLSNMTCIDSDNTNKSVSALVYNTKKKEAHKDMQNWKVIYYFNI